MNALKAYKILQKHWSQDDSNALIDAISENNSSGTKDIELKIMQEFTKMNGELVKIYGQLNIQTWKYIGGLTLVVILSKLFDFFVFHKPIGG